MNTDVTKSQIAKLEGALEVLATLHGVSVILVGVLEDGLEGQVLGTTGLVLLVLLLGDLHHGGALVFRGRFGHVVAETALEELGTAGLVKGLVFREDKGCLSGSVVLVVQVLASTVLLVLVLLAALALHVGLQLHVLEQALAVLVVRLFGAQTELSAPGLVAQTGTSEVLLDVQEEFSPRAVALVLVLQARLGTRVPARRVSLVLQVLLVRARTIGGNDLLRLVADTVGRRGAIVHLLLAHLANLSRTGTIRLVELLLGVLVLWTDLLRGVFRAVRLVHAILMLARHFAFRGEQQLLFLQGLVLSRKITRTGGHDFLLFPSRTDLSRWW